MTSTNGKQFELIVEFMEQNEGIAKNFLNALQYKETTNLLWANLTETLNAAGPPEKSTDGWKKVWKDFKYNTKNKIRYNKKAISGTGGPYKIKKLTNLEERVDKVLDLTGELEGIIAKSFGCVIPSSNMSVPYTENVEILQEFYVEEVAQNTEPLEVETAIINSTVHSSNSTQICRKPQNKSKETSKMLLQKQIELQKKFYECSEKFQNNILKVLKEIRNIQESRQKCEREKQKYEKEKWKAKYKLLMEKTKQKAEYLKLKRMEIDLKKRSLDAHN